MDGSGSIQLRDTSQRGVVVVVVVVVEQPVTLNYMGVLIQISFCSCRLPDRTFVHEVGADLKKSQV